MADITSFFESFGTSLQILYGAKKLLVVMLAAPWIFFVCLP